MVAFDRLVAAVMLALLIAAAIVVSALFGGAGQLHTFAEVRSVCETSFASACYNTGRAPATWTMPTQNVDGREAACSEILDCTCSGPGSGGSHSCTGIPA